MPLDLSQLGKNLGQFQGLLDKTAEELASDHPQKQLLQRLAAMFRAQRTAVGDAMTRFNEVAKEQLAKSKAELEAFQKEFAPTRDKIQGMIDAAKAGTPPPSRNGKAAADKAAAGKLPHIDIDPNFGTDLGKELLERYHLLKKRLKSFDDREIWQDWK